MLNTPRTILTQLLPTNRVNSTKPRQKPKRPTGTESPGEHRDTGATTSIAQTAPEGWEEPLELGPCPHTAPGREVSPPHLVTVEQHHWFSPLKPGHLPAPSVRKPLSPKKGLSFSERSKIKREHASQVLRPQPQTASALSLHILQQHKAPAHALWEGPGLSLLPQDLSPRVLGRRIDPRRTARTGRANSASSPETRPGRSSKHSRSQLGIEERGSPRPESFLIKASKSDKCCQKGS